MKFGCVGCFLLLLILTVVLVAGGVVMYFGGAAFDTPRFPKVEYTTADGYSAQHKLFELLSPESRRAARRVVLTERELNAFLARHLEESARIPFSPLAVKLSPGTIRVVGKTRLGNLFQGFPFSLLADHLPASTVDRPVWVTVRGTIEVERWRAETERRYGQFQVSEFSLGNQDMGPWILSLMLGGKGRSLLQWQVPAAVDTITVEQEQIVVTTRG